ncbi:ArsR/SmtB family transcription factor [Actinomadura macra]|uniref:ArsR/SmtB family transcription factor n=1 Tax=Actinomadura macra TaxID=46164 RepID=UPI000834B7C5|nr:metalloregulator ArsR/SmtB family transcription factor [Actinomadura macra]
MAQPSRPEGESGVPRELLEEHARAKDLAPKLRAVADENRLTLLLLLAQGPHTVKQLQEATGLSQTLVSHHLAPLREHGLVEAVPRGRSNVYTLCCTALIEPVKILAGLASLTPEGINALVTDLEQAQP